MKAAISQLSGLSRSIYQLHKMSIGVYPYARLEWAEGRAEMHPEAHGC